MMGAKSDCVPDHISALGLEKVRAALFSYHEFRAASSRPISWEDIRDQIYMSDATALKLPEDFFLTEVDSSDADSLELQDEALRRFALGSTKMLRKHKHLVAVVDFLIDVGFLHSSELANPSLAHHIRCNLANALGLLCYDDSDAHMAFVGSYYCLSTSSNGRIVETLLKVIPAPGKHLLQASEVSLIYDSNSGEPVSFVEGRRFRLEFNKAVVRVGTATLSCRKNLIFSFPELKETASWKLEASLATMRRVAFNDEEATRAIAFELHGDHPLYDHPVAKFERVVGKKLLERKRRIDTKLKNWRRQN